MYKCICTDGTMGNANILPVLFSVKAGDQVPKSVASFNRSICELQREQLRKDGICFPGHL
ncbi:hypothetical protein D3C72_2532210 [compost metagenome]